MQPIVNLVLVSRIQERKRRMTQESLLLPLAWTFDNLSNNVCLYLRVTVNPCMNMSVP